MSLDLTTEARAIHIADWRPNREDVAIELRAADGNAIIESISILNSA